ncbi:Conserved hypothetical protein [gamma proteobacterium HdN1]|nr:Conserved hypothetical protein [gamma proteobacterium HdN1]
MQSLTLPPEFLSRLDGLQRPYVTLMMAVMGRAMEAASQIDPIFQSEVGALDNGFLFEMTIQNGPGMVMQKQADGSLKHIGNQCPRKPDLSIRFKHITHAFLVLSFQESTARAFANDRMVVDGDLSYAMKMVRCLNRLEAFILPKLVAERAVKRYPSLPVQEKLRHGMRIYSRVAANLLTR